MPEYQPDAAIYLVGLTVVEFSREYSKDWSNFSVERARRHGTWKTDAKQFQAVWRGLKDNARGSPAAAKSATSCNFRPEFLLDKMEKYLDVEPARLQDCILQVAKMRPKDGKVFKTLSMPALTLP